MARINFQFTYMPFHQLAGPDTQFYAKLPTDFYERYEIYDFVPKPFNIISFVQIGMCDPFPTEPQIKYLPIEKPSDLAYFRERFTKGQSPGCIYIPSPEIMFKLMRSCVEVPDHRLLWFKIDDPAKKKEKMKQRNE